MSRRGAGFTLIELVVVIAILGILTAAAVSSFRTSQYEFRAAISEIIADIRLARTLALGRGAHYQFRVVDASTYVVERLRLDGSGSWVPDAADRRSKRLPHGARLSPTRRGRWKTEIEFDTRGTRVGSDPPIHLVRVTEPRSGAFENISIWMSGQVYP